MEGATSEPGMEGEPSEPGMEGATVKNLGLIPECRGSGPSGTGEWLRAVL